MVEPLLCKLGIQSNLCAFKSTESIDLHNITQTCSNIGGVVVLCMAASMCCNWQSCNDSMAPKCLSKPSFYSNHLRLTVMLEEEME